MSCRPGSSGRRSSCVRKGSTAPNRLPGATRPPSSRQSVTRCETRSVCGSPPTVTPGGQLIGQEILEHYDYRGVVMRVIFTAQDPQTIRDAFAQAKPNIEYARLYAAAVARRQADQIYNLSLTRTATVTLARGTRTVIGVGRVKTRTLSIVCKRELEIRNFVPQSYFEVVAMAQVEGGQFRIRHAPKERIVKRDEAGTIAAAAAAFEGPLMVRAGDTR